MQHEEVYALTNGDFRHFHPSLCIPVDLSTLPFKVLNEMFAVGEDYVKDLEEIRSKEKVRREAVGSNLVGVKTKKGQAMRDRNPW